MSDSGAIPNPKSRPRRRWFRFSLRTLLVLIALFAIPLAWYVNRAERQRRVVKWLKDNNASAYYEFENDDFDAMYRDRSPWLQKWIPVDYLSTVRCIDIQPDASVSNLDFGSELPGVRKLLIWEDLDLSNIHAFANLQTLHILLERKSIDLSPLGRLSNLKELEIRAKSISELQALSGRSKLVELTICLYGSKDLDLAPLCNLDQLRLLYVTSEKAGVYGSQVLELSSVSDAIIEAERIGDLSVFSKMVNLESISLDGRRIENLHGISSLKKLKEIYLRNRVRGMGRSEIPRESEMPLVDDDGKLRDLSMLLDLPNLRKVVFGDNVVVDFDSVKNLTKLEELSFDGSPITSAQLTVLRDVLPRCKIVAD